MLHEYFYAAESAARLDRLRTEAYVERLARSNRISRRTRRGGHTANRRHAGTSVSQPS